jgi:hypothetical protein
MTDNIFTTLLHLDVNDRVDKKRSGGAQLSYLSWAWAWAEFKKAAPEGNYQVKWFDNGNGPDPFYFSPSLGYMVFTEVTVGDITHEMWLPVMDGANKAMKNVPYEYTVKSGKKQVAAATMFDINKTLMRCLVKNLAMFGLGLYIYAGEDLPEMSEEQIQAAENALKEQQAKDEAAREAKKRELTIAKALSNGFPKTREKEFEGKSTQEIAAIYFAWQEEQAKTAQ